MTVWIRMALLVFTGWLMGSGLISEEVGDILTHDPAVVESINALVSAAILGIPLWWRRLAKKHGWST